MSENEGGDSRFMSGFLIGFVVGVLVCVGVGGTFLVVSVLLGTLSAALIIAQAVLAILLASATAATFALRRARSCTSHGRCLADRPACRMTAMDPTTSIWRR